MAVSVTFFDIPAEIILHIFSYLDLPDLACLALLSPSLACLASDNILHKNRIRIVAPSRVGHSLFGQGAHGYALRPTVGDLVHRGVMRGLGIERQWRMGGYFYSHNAVKQYENALRLQRRATSIVISSHLRKRVAGSKGFKVVHQSSVFPDIESSSLSVSRTLLPVMRKLKWSFQKDQLAKKVRAGDCRMFCIGVRPEGAEGLLGFGQWAERDGKGVVEDGERVRLAVCPGIRKIVKYYEDLRVGH